MRKLLVAVMLIFSGATLAQEAPGKVLEAAVNQVIRPGMSAFAEKAGVLEGSVAALCSDPSAEGLETAHDAFADAAIAYGHVEFIRIGPLMEDNRAERLLFFPDRKGIGLRQVQAILANEDTSAADVASLRGKSVAVQGFGALEFVLHGTGFDALTGAEGQFRCQYGAAIAANISDIADELASAWQQENGIAAHLMQPAPEYDDYRTPTEALEEIVGLVSHGLEATRDTRINPFIAKADAAPKPKLALFWRSGLTMAMIRANLEGMRRFIDQSGVARNVAEKDKGLDNSIVFEFSNANRALDLVTSPVDQAVEDPKQVQALNYLVLVTGSLQAQVGEQLSAALGLSVGFSSLDGD